MNEAELQKMTVVKLRELAHEEAQIQGVSGMKKDQLIEALKGYYQGKGEWEEKAALSPEAKAEPKKTKGELSKSEIKARIAVLKSDRDKALAEKKAAVLKRTRRKIKRYKRALRRTSSS